MQAGRVRHPVVQQFHHACAAGRFGGLLHARAWLQPFFGWHNDEHHHSGLALFTPAEVFFDRVAHVREARQSALDAAFTAHPERFPNGPPIVALPPTEVSINPLTTGVVAVAQEAAAADSTSRQDCLAIAAVAAAGDRRREAPLSKTKSTTSLTQFTSTLSHSR